MKEIKFRYFGDIGLVKGSGKITVAMFGNKCGLSFCSPKDKFNKMYGKSLAIVRLITKPFELPTDKNMTYDEWIDFFYSLGEKNIPGWMYNQHNYI